MQTNLFWKANEYPSLENYVVTISDAGSEISSIIIGLSESKIFKVEYNIKTNQRWETEHVSIKSHIGGSMQSLSFYNNGKSAWLKNGLPIKQFDGCIDIYLPLTPFTNTLPINGFNLKRPGSPDKGYLYRSVASGLYAFCS
jgi:hypothetical protein